MTRYETLSLVIGGSTLMVAVLSIGLGLIVRITRRWTLIEQRLEALVNRITEAIEGGREDYGRLEHRVDRNEDRINRHEEYHATMLGH